MSATPLPSHPPTWRHRLRNALLAGLLIVVPVYITVRVLWLLFIFMDGAFAPVIDRAVGVFLEQPVHIPGLGLLLTLLSLLFLGWLSSKVLGRRIIEGVESLIRRIPVAKSLYGATKGVLEAVSRDQADAFKRVVLVEFPRRGIYAIGFVTNSTLHWPTPGPDSGVAELLPVFIPKTPNPTGGFLLMVPPAQVIDCPMSVEDGIRMIVSGGILQPEAVLPQPLQPAASPPAPAGPVPVASRFDAM